VTREGGTHELQTADRGVSQNTEQKRVRGTHSLETVERLVRRTWKESDRVWGTHPLETAVGGASQGK